MRRARLARLGALTAGLCVAGAAVAAPPDGLARAVDDELARALEAAGGADVVAFELPSKPGAPHVRAATIANAAPATVTAALVDAARYGALVPAIVRSQEIARRADARVVDWEVEVPLSNLEGTFELRTLGGRVELTGVELTFVDGDLSPGRLAFHVAARADGRTTLTLDARLDVRKTSWVVRTALDRSAYGEPAALAAAAWVALHAVALRAEHPRDATAWRPTAPLIASRPDAPNPIDGRALFSPALAALAARGAAALVRVAPSGRLAAVSVGVPTRGVAAALAARFADPRSWHLFPGWKKIVPMPPVGGAPPTIVVEDSIPFVDLDATWRPLPGVPARAWTAIDGDARGAWFAWDVAPTGLQAALTMAPRLDRTGSIPRRFIEAEPLLEHGLSLALAFVDAVSATR
jgi:hypothetical protein